MRRECILTTTFIALVTIVLLIGAPFYLLLRQFQKAHAENTSYTPEKLYARFRRGFYLIIYGIELAFGFVPLLALIFFDVPTVLKFAFPIGSLIIGLLMYFTGYTIVATGTVYLNHRRRELTSLEELTLAAMDRVLSHAQYDTLAGNHTAVSDDTNDILHEVENAGILHGLFAAGKLYTGKSFGKRYWPVILILAVVAVCAMVTWL